MEVSIILTCAVILLSTFPVIRGVSNIKENKNVADMAIDESSPSSIMVQNSFHLFPPIDETSEMYDAPQFQDSPLARPSANNRYSLQSDYMQSMEQKIDSLVRSNEIISKIMTNLEEKVNRILEAVDPKNKRSPKDDCDLMDTFEIMNKLNNIHQHIIASSLEPNQVRVIREFVSAMENEKKNLKHTEHCAFDQELSIEYLKNVRDIVQGIDERTVRMFDQSCRQSQDNNRNSGRIPGSSYSIDQYDQHKCRSDPTSSRRQYDGYKRTSYRNVKRDISRVSFVPEMYNCHDLKKRKNGIYKFNSMEELSNESGRFYDERYCDFDTNGVAWTVIQRRFMNDQPENFNRSWLDYKLGFGQLDKEFWFGNDFIHKLTFDEDVELRIVLEDTSGRKNWAEYSLFKVDSETYNYNLIIGGYRGSFPDHFLYHNDQEFSTYDRQNGNNDNISCASSYGNGWWFNNCTEMSTPDYKGIIWENWLGSNLLRSSKMMVRPKGLWNGEGSNKDDDEYIFTSTALDP